MYFIFRLAGAGVCLALAGTVSAANLSAVYQAAQAADPDYLAAQAMYEAAQEGVPQARAGVLPELNADVQAEWRKQNLKRGVSFNPGSGNDFTYKNYSYSLHLQQPLYRRDRWVALQQADSRLAQAGAGFEMTRQVLILRTAEAYFAVLARQAELGFTRSLERSLQRQFEQASQRLEVGLGTATDVEEARAGYDLAVARGIQAVNELAIARERLRVLTGVYPSPLHVLGGRFSPALPGGPEDVQAWERVASEYAPEIHAARYGLATSTLETERRRSGHYPNLDLIGQAGFYSNGGRFGQSDTEDIAVGLQLQLPLYLGNRVRSATREALRIERSARHGLESARRQVRRRVHESYLNLLSGRGRIQALQQAVRSSDTALAAIHAGFEVGTRTSVDVVEAERALSEARRDYALARYDYILALLHLKRAAGILSTDDLAEVDNWLEPASENSVSQEEPE